MRKFVLLGILNLVLVIAALYLFEALLYATDPRRTLPKDGMFGAVHYTWGHEVRNNRLGFREREFVVPKPANTCRIMVLGDSLTWGAGLAPEGSCQGCRVSHIQPRTRNHCVTGRRCLGAERR